MPGDGAELPGAQFVVDGAYANSYRVTSDFHADTSASDCASPAGCYGVPGGDVVLRNCSTANKAQAWAWQAEADEDGRYLLVNGGTVQPLVKIKTELPE